MNEITIRTCSDEDLLLLATLNKQLVEDEQHDNSMNINQLIDRMKGFIHTDYKAYIFEDKCKVGKVVGYALVNCKKQPLYLRQFFICRDCRRNGYGKKAFEILLDTLNTKHIDIEVMNWNSVGYSFWKSLGFKERSIYMRL